MTEQEPGAAEPPPAERRAGVDRRRTVDLTRAEKGLPERRQVLRERRRRHEERGEDGG